MAMPKKTTPGEIPVGSDAPEDGKDEDAFEETPTVANRANPTSTAGAGGEEASSTAVPSEGAGTYRIVRPATPDFVDTPAPTKTDPNASRRSIIGSTRKSR
jgi:hypothetical protein